MLNKLLELINQGGSMTPAHLATQLSTTPAMVEMMMEELVRKGLLKSSDLANNCESGSCSTCYLANSCTPKIQRVWTTNKK